MAHAVVINVEFSNGGSPEDGQTMLRGQVVPNAKRQPGFQNGTWLSHAGKGLAVIVFDTAENAETAKAQLRPPPGGPTIISSEVYEVGAQA